MDANMTSTTTRLLLVALVAAGALLWPASAAAGPIEAPPGTYTFNGRTFDTTQARFTARWAGGTSYVFDNGYTYHWNSYYERFTSSTNDSRWWTYRGRTTRDKVELDGCTYVQHRRGEFEINAGYRFSCTGGAGVARYVVRYRKAPPGFRCLKRTYDFYCTRFAYGRQTAHFTYRPGFVQEIRHEMVDGTMECGAVSTTNGESGKPGKYVVFSRDLGSCEAAFSSPERLENMAAYTAVHGAPGGEHHSIGDGINMACYKIPSHDSTLMCSGGGGRCVILGRFSKGEYPRVLDEWAWSVIATARIDPFTYC